MFLISCSTKPDIKETDKLTPIEKVNQSSELVEEGDFIYRLVTEQHEYEASDSVKVYAELEYIGEKEEVTIYHAASPFYFNIVEKTRGYLIGYNMDEPLIASTLKKGEPLREEYVNSGGFSEQDDADYIEFIKDFWENGFPSGYYVVDGTAEFYLETGEGKTDYYIAGVVDFEVKE
jgi:hypothetical protein